MSTSLLNCEVELSKQLGDYWSGTTTSTGSSTTVVDTALKAKENDWVEKGMYDMITSGTYDEEERRISSLDNSSGTLTVLAHGGTIASGVTYRVHRLLTASEKRRALVHGAKAGYPYIHEYIKDESMVSGNWLKDGSFEIWTSATAPTYWGKSGTETLGQTSTSPYYKHGSYSCKISGDTGYIYQDIAKWDDLKHLAGKTVTFTAQVWCDTASCCRLGILYDGTNLTYSDYHDGDSAWTKHNDPLSVEYTIDDNPTDIEFRIYYATSGNIYVDDARVMAGSIDSPRLYIGDLGLAKNTPRQVLIEPSNYSTEEPWALIHNIEYDRENGYMKLPSSVSVDYRLRIIGMGYLDFYDTAGDVGTDWDDTINIDSPQLEILVAEAAIYLAQQMILPTQTQGTNEKWMQALAHWKNELRERRGKFGMSIPSATVSWR